MCPASPEYPQPPSQPLQLQPHGGLAAGTVRCIYLLSLPHCLSCTPTYPCPSPFTPRGLPLPSRPRPTPLHPASLIIASFSPRQIVQPRDAPEDLAP